MGGRKATIRIKTNLKRLKEKYKKNPLGLKQDSNKNASTRILTRIIIYLSEIQEEAILTEIREGTNNHTSKIKDALNWLVNNKIILKKKSTRKWKGSHTNCYIINPAWRALKQ